jgi:hypothetical protein
MRRAFLIGARLGKYTQPLGGACLSALELGQFVDKFRLNCAPINRRPERLVIRIRQVLGLAAADLIRSLADVAIDRGLDLLTDAP